MRWLSYLLSWMWLSSALDDVALAIARRQAWHHRLRREVKTEGSNVLPSCWISISSMSLTLPRCAVLHVVVVRTILRLATKENKQDQSPRARGNPSSAGR